MAGLIFERRNVLVAAAATLLGLVLATPLPALAPPVPPAGVQAEPPAR